MGNIVSALQALLDASNVAVNRPAADAGMAILKAGGDFADGLIASKGREARLAASSVERRRQAAERGATFAHDTTVTAAL